ncbi:hypothetical protein T10_8355 [Trichinella papuae]|uniref:Uncharacterized protein n=1 Tax=Trichinella papuae TaxID=268474 RepID=A0A0V1MNS1_9BILA|nr:hypothetical protein T10_8355 [Trichinella papuae]
MGAETELSSDNWVAFYRSLIGSDGSRGGIGKSATLARERELGWVDPRLLGSDRVVQELGYNCHFVLPMERVEMEEIELSKIQSHNCNCKPKEQASKGTGSSQWTTPLAAYIKQMFNRPNRAFVSFADNEVKISR